MANATELCSLADLKAYLKITSGTYDAILQSIKDSTEQFVKDYCGRDFLVTAYTNDYYDGDGSSRLRTRQRPIISVDSIFCDPARLFGANTQIPTSAIINDQRSWNVGFIELYIWRFLFGLKSVQLNYTAGYATIPADLAHAVKLICAREYLLQDKNLTGQVSQDVGDRKITMNLDSIPKNAVEILDRYRRIEI